MNRVSQEQGAAAPRKPAADLSWPAIFRQYAAFALLGLGIVGGAVYFVYQRIDDEIRTRLERVLQEHYAPRGFHVRVRSVVWQEGVGFEVHDLAILDPETRPMETLHVEEVRIPCDRHLQDLLTGHWTPSQIVLKRPKMAIVTREGASPRAFDLFPLPPLNPNGRYPSVTIEGGEIAWIDPQRPNERIFESRQINGTITPSSQTEVAPRSREASHAKIPTIFDVNLVARADRMERLDLRGTIAENAANWSLTADLHRVRATPELLDVARAAGVAMPLPTPKFHGEVTVRVVASSRSDRTGAAPSTQGLRPPLADATKREKASDPLATLPFKMSIAGEFRDFSVDDERLPLPIAETNGAFVLDERGLTISRAAGRVGRGTFWLSGSVRDLAGDPTIQARIKLRQIWLDATLAQTMSPQYQEAYGRLSPVGTIHADFDVARTAGVWTGEAVVEAAGVTITPREFPYPVSETTGVVRWQGGSLTVQLAGKAAGQAVRLEGVIADPLADGPGRIDVKVDRPIPIDERLIAAAVAAAPRAESFLRDLQIQGLIAVEGALVRETQRGPIKLQLGVTLSDGSFRHREFPYPLDDVQGRFRLEEGRWTFERVGGRNGVAFFLADGWLETNPRVGRRLSVKAVGTDVPIDETFLQALQGSARSTCREMRIRGSLDQAAIDWSYDFDRGASDFGLRAWKWRLPGERSLGGEISLQPGCFPYLFENVTGELRYERGRLTMTGIRAMHGEEIWSANLAYESLPTGGWTFAMDDLTVDRLSPHDQFRQALPTPAAKFFAGRDVQGAFAVRGSLRVSKPAAQEPIATEWNMAVDVERASFGSTFPLRHVHGELQLAGRHDAEGFRSRGEIRIDSALYRDYQITNVQGPVAVDSEQVLLGAWAEPRLTDRPPRSLVGTAFGGRLESDCQFRLDDAGTFTVQSRLNEADLTSLAQNAASGYQEVSGKLDGLLNLTGSAEGLHTLRGSGYLRLRDARIYEAPLVTTLLKSIPGKNPETPLFQTTDVDFRVQGSHIYLDRCNFHGDAMTLKGQGEIGFDRRISLDFYAVAGKDKLQIPVLTPALGLASRQILQIHVDGTLDEPIVENKPLPVLKETLDQVFPEAAAEPEVAKLPSPLNWLREATRY